ncbi:MAG: VOC family protein, partial [Anaerolineae bacterium]|nr:VOC family protein [Anaerolineae bacterium]
MTERGIGTHVVTQIAIVVKDMGKAIEAYSRIFGLPKPTAMLTDSTNAHAVYRGAPTNAQAKLA